MSAQISSLKPLIFSVVAATLCLPVFAAAADPSCPGRLASATVRLGALFMEAGRQNKAPDLLEALNMLAQNDATLAVDEKMKLLTHVYSAFNIKSLPSDQQMKFNVFTSQFIAATANFSVGVPAAAQNPAPSTKSDEAAKATTSRNQIITSSAVLQNILAANPARPSLILISDSANCGYCAKFKADGTWETFSHSQPEVVSGQVSTYQIDLESPEFLPGTSGREALKKLNITGLPAFVMVDGKGFTQTKVGVPTAPGLNWMATTVAARPK